MNDKMFTEKELIQALDCCRSETRESCRKCPLYDVDECDIALMEYALDFINRQKAEIERLKGSIIADNIMESQRIKKEAKAEAYKEFAERLKEEIEKECKNNLNAAYKHIKRHEECPDYNLFATLLGETSALGHLNNFVDNLLREMVGEE